MIERAKYNQMANINNPHQTNTTKVLCLCSAGLLRSPTMANVLHAEYSYNTRSAGVSTDYALIPVTEALVAWADMIVFAERSVFEELRFRMEEDQRYLLENKSLFILNLPDCYGFNNKNLRQLIVEQFNEAEDCDLSEL